MSPRGVEEARARGKTVLVLHGPNLNLLGLREPDVYGALTLEQIDERLHALASELGVELEIFQSNVEGELVNRIQEAAGVAHAILINPGRLYPHERRHPRRDPRRRTAGRRGAYLQHPQP